ncbi:MAG: hypothetical protein ACE5EY_11915, partial [Anaerolineae bacterium]
AGSALPPVGETFTITARVTDLAGQTAVVTHTVWADVVPPAPITMTLSYDNAGSPQLITPGMTIRDVLTPTLLITWPAASDDGSGIAGYRAGWTVTPTLSVAQIINLPAYAAAGQHAQVVGEAQPVYAHLVIEDNAGNETAQTMGPVYVDAPLTPDYVGQADSLSYRGWMESGCSLVGVDRRLAERAPLTPEQRFYLTWDDANLRLAWTGADWDVDGDLFVYLDTEAGGSSQAYDPYTSTMTNTAVYLPGVTPISVQPDAMQADYLVWVQDADTAVLLHWNGGSWITQTLLTSAQFQFDRRLADPLFPERPAGQTDLILPFSLLGLSAGSPVDALAFATEEGALRLWATMPGANPLNSGRAAGTAVYAADQHIFALNQRYHWDNLDSGVCANGAYPGGDLQTSLTVEPSGAVYRFLADDLFWQWATLLGNRPADASLGVPLVDGDPPPLADGQAISYTLTYRNQGRETAVGARVVLSATYALRLPGGDLPGQTTQTVWLGDVAAGATGSVVFQGEIVVPANCAATTGDACQWAGLTAEIYDDAHPESGPPLEWMWADHRVDSRPPEFFGVLRPEFLLAAGENVLYGYAYDEAGVSAVTLEVQSPLAGTSLLTCPDGTPGDGRWSCLLDAAGANDGDVFSLRLGASDAFGQASDLANERPVTFVVDASPPTVTVTTPTGLLNDTAFVLNGRIADNWGLGGVAVCLNGECETADLQLETAVLPVAVTDAPGTPLALGSATGCGGGEIARTLMVT